MLDEFVDVLREVLVLGDVGPRRHADLDQSHLAHPLRVPAQEELECEEFVRHALDVVQTVHADDGLAPREAAKEDLLFFERKKEARCEKYQVLGPRFGFGT